MQLLILAALIVIIGLLMMTINYLQDLIELHAQRDTLIDIADEVQ